MEFGATRRDKRLHNIYLFIYIQLSPTWHPSSVSSWLKPSGSWRQTIACSATSNVSRKRPATSRTTFQWIVHFHLSRWPSTSRKLMVYVQHCINIDSIWGISKFSSLRPHVAWPCTHITQNWLIIGAVYSANKCENTSLIYIQQIMNCVVHLYNHC